jgi:hypothetical protein
LIPSSTRHRKEASTVEGQIKVGLRNGAIIVLIIVLVIPALKNAAVKGEAWLPAPIRNWILAV